MNVISNEQFFDSAAGYYDSMVDFKKGLEKKKKLFTNFILSGMETAADFGCGTGMDSIALTMAGLNVTGFDVSKEMLAHAEKNSKHFNTQIEFHKYSLTKIPQKFKDKFNIVTSLGNALANLNKEDLSTAIEKAYKLLKPDGRLLIQILNYDLILKSKKRIIKIASEKDYQMIRFYDFHLQHLDFNILRYNISKPSYYKLLTTHIYPHTISIIKSIFEKTGFKNVRLFGGLDKSPFRKTLSKDLVVFAAK